MFGNTDKSLERVWLCRDKKLLLGDSPLIMGILNVTPDSFSDGGEAMTVSDAMAKARRMVAAGTDIIDVGGMSTRPGFADVSEEDEQKRVLPVLAALRTEFPEFPISIDTFRVEVARRSLDAGADIINDVAALVSTDSTEMYKLVAQYGAGLVIMHAPQGLTYGVCDEHDGTEKDFVSCVVNDLNEAVHQALQAGVDGKAIACDPGIGFGKTPDLDLKLLTLGSIALRGLPYPVLIGASRKSFLSKITGAVAVEERIAPSVLAHMMACVCGADIIRVHDVRQHRHALDVLMRDNKGKPGNSCI
ncbi:MAG: dihydropteroate synthase [Candidatus Sumerlaeales bacterium]|nr:dihydropteroate synthase [Candidatus Sumerlaeales bacterium]